ncbi:MAG: ABC transporter permease [Anaerolineales bacterium]
MELIKYRELLGIWIGREIKIRYKQSFLGAAWAILQPLALMLVFTLVFSRFVQVPTDGIPYPVFSYTAVLPWTFLATAIAFGVPSLVSNMNLVTKTYFPREILPLGAIGASFVDFIVASSIFVVMLYIYDVQLTSFALWVPVLLLLQILLTIGITLLASSIIVFYRDVRFIVPIALQLWLYATPIIYPASLVPESLRTLYALNPMVGIIEGYRATLLFGQPPPNSIIVSAVVSVFLVALGYFMFKRLEPSFADII